MLSSAYTPQPYIFYDNQQYYYGTRFKYVCHMPTSDIMYMVAHKAIFKFSYITYTWEKYVITTLDNNSTVELYNPTLTGGFISNITDGICSVIEYSTTVGYIFFDSSFYGDSRYVDEGAYVTPIIDTFTNSMFMYAIEYTENNNDTIDVYVRYSKYPPIDYAHLHYCDNTTFLEKSIATGKVFNTFNVTEKNSCAVYYDDEVYKVTLDGNVYYNSDFSNPNYTFDIISYALTGIKQTWFSYNGTFILYMLNDGYMAGFPLGLGYACSRVKPSFSFIYDVVWNKFIDSFSLRTDVGVMEFNYKLGVTYKSTNYIYKFYTDTCVVYVKQNSECEIVSNDYLYTFTHLISNLDSSKRIVHDYNSDFLFYVDNISGTLRKLSFVIINGDIDICDDSVGISNITEIESVSRRYIVVNRFNKLVVLTNNGGILSEYDVVNKDSGGLVFHKYSNNYKVDYYRLFYIYNNDLVWFDMMPWLKLGYKNKGVIRGNRYVQFKTVLKASTDNTTTPILERIFVGGPVRIGPIYPHDSIDFYITVDIPIDDSCDIYSTKIESYFETLLFDEDS